MRGMVHIFKYLAMEACRGEKLDALYLPISDKLRPSRPGTGRCVTMATAHLTVAITDTGKNEERERRKEGKRERERERERGRERDGEREMERERERERERGRNRGNLF